MTRRLLKRVTVFAICVVSGATAACAGVHDDLIPAEEHIYALETRVVPVEDPTDLDGTAMVKPLIEITSDTSLPRVSPLPMSNPTSEVIGRWKGMLPMGDHAHPITYHLIRGDNGGIQVQSNFSEDDELNTIEYTFNTIRIMLDDAGILFTGRFNASDRLEGTVDWMGRTLPLTLNKNRTDKNAKHGKETPRDKTVEPDEMEHAHSSRLTRTKVAILIFDGVDTLDWAGPLEVFDNAHVFDTYTVAPSKRAYRGSGHRIFADYSFDNMPTPDIVVVPGGDIGHVFHKQAIMDWIGNTAEQANITMSVCNGSLLLAHASLLENRSATTHAAWMGWLEEMSTEHDFLVVRGTRFVDNGSIVTTAGVSSGIDGALHIVARLRGIGVARMAARNMEYEWHPESPDAYSP